MDAGFRETVLVVSGSSARLAAECKDRPVDAAIVGIVDTVQLDAQHEAELADCAEEISRGHRGPLCFSDASSAMSFAR